MMGQKYGTKMFPPLKYIGVDRYICPLLHMKLGNLGSETLLFPISWIGRTRALSQAKEDYFDKEIKLDALKAAWFHANALGAAQLAEKRKRRVEITKCLGRKKVVRLMSSEDLTKLKEEKILLTEEINALMAIKTESVASKKSQG
jgi:hypothetical protein